MPEVRQLRRSGTGGLTACSARRAGGRHPPQDGAPGDVHWRSIPKDNILTLYGFDANSRIADPLEPSRI